MGRESYRDRAFVVRTYDFGEADRVVVLLTRSHGLVRSVAKGVRKSKSRFGSRIQPFVDVDIQLYPGRNLDTITQADTVGYYGTGIIDDYDRYTAACAILETAERLSYADADTDSFLFDEIAHAFRRLPVTAHPTLVVDAFIVRATAHAGWGLSLFNCANCGRPGPHHAFHSQIGGAACVHCRPPGSFDVEEETLHLLWLLAQNDTPQVRDRAEAQAEAQASKTTVHQAHRLATHHLQWHMESALKTLRIMEQA
ncbi:DNA repair protein RecO [Corynebacterium aquatimens]|uniref:DNA repair protein RecO n=1 Tax=Corynebacterium aquatimens TaxID=1190508 RepID=A0A931DV47_9CORY|nr:DNA repair protein RecO [Corynebacterium aquatimens]MBG6122079.1 DNA repair protein RecO (recombination protein O) [Corynebacterium aquatimens]